MVGLFGVPKTSLGYLQQAVMYARGLVDTGAKVAIECSARATKSNRPPAFTSL